MGNARLPVPGSSSAGSLDGPPCGVHSPASASAAGTPCCSDRRDLGHRQGKASPSAARAARVIGGGAGPNDTSRCCRPALGAMSCAHPATPAFTSRNRQAAPASTPRFGRAAPASTSRSAPPAATSRFRRAAPGHASLGHHRPAPTALGLSYRRRRLPRRREQTPLAPPSGLPSRRPKTCPSRVGRPVLELPGLQPCRSAVPLAVALPQLQRHRSLCASVQAGSFTAAHGFQRRAQAATSSRLVLLFRPRSLCLARRGR